MLISRSHSAFGEFLGFKEYIDIYYIHFLIIILFYASHNLHVNG